MEAANGMMRFVGRPLGQETWRRKGPHCVGCKGTQSPFFNSKLPTYVTVIPQNAGASSRPI
jgi:hypothetical protein